MKKRGLMFMFCLFSLIFFAFADKTEGGVATIYGKVTRQDGAPSSATPVTIRVVNPVTIYGVQKSDFPWKSITTTTDANGNYQAAILFPDIVEIKFKAEAIYTGYAPFESGSNEISFIDFTPLNNGYYNLDISLSQVINGAVIQGYLKDKETGEPLINYDVYIAAGDNLYRYRLEADSDGFYKGLIDLLAEESNVTLKAPVQDPQCGPWGCEEINYYMQWQAIYAVSGNIYDVNFEVAKNSSFPYVYGTVTDINDQPIPFATVSVRHIPSGFPMNIPATDFLGRYKQYLLEDSDFSVSTTGEHTQDENKSSYYSQSKSIGAGVVSGKAYRIDFQLSPKPMPKEEHSRIAEQ